jgi:hypothetical protein
MTYRSAGIAMPANAAPKVAVWKRNIESTRRGASQARFFDRGAPHVE